MIVLEGVAVLVVVEAILKATDAALVTTGAAVLPRPATSPPKALPPPNMQAQDLALGEKPKSILFSSREKLKRGKRKTW
jgi:hypothetical protein